MGRASFGEYAAAWIKKRPGLRPNTVEVYQYVFARHLQPFFGNRAVADIREAYVRRWRSELAGGGRMFGPPKSAAGRRVVVVPAVIRPALALHLETFTASQFDALVFTSSTGAPLRDGNFRRRVWRPALAEAGLPDTHFHDLRHTGNTLTATAGASLRELMGHSSPRPRWSTCTAAMLASGL